MNSFLLKDLIKIHNGKDYKHLNNGAIPVYGSGGIMTYVDNCLFDGESILLPRKGTLNNIQYVNGKFWCVDTTYWATSICKNVNFKYLHSYLTLLDLTARDSGSTLPSMTFDSYYSLPIKLPDIEVQNTVAKLLKNIDNKIEINNKTIQALESLAKTIYDYWFLQFEFPNEEGKPYKSSGGKMVWNEELKIEIPEGWDTKELLSICSWESASQPPKSEFIYQKKEGYVRFVQNRDYESNDNITYIPLKSTTKLCNKYDILIDKYGDKTAGKIRYGIDGAYNVALGKISTSIPNFQEYLRSFLSNESMFNYLHNACMASTRASLNETVFKGVIVLIPDKKTLIKFEDFIKSIIDENFRKKEQNQHLASLRDWLLPMLMNGQVTFKETSHE